jgi:hypothetical protein
MSGLIDKSPGKGGLVVHIAFLCSFGVFLNPLFVSSRQEEGSGIFAESALTPAAPTTCPLWGVEVAAV